MSHPTGGRLISNTERGPGGCFSAKPKTSSPPREPRNIGVRFSSSSHLHHFRSTQKRRTETFEATSTPTGLQNSHPYLRRCLLPTDPSYWRWGTPGNQVGQ